MTVETLVGAAAGDMVRRPGFVAAWRALHARCPWATVFQDDRFVLAWYETYRSCYDPVIVTSGDGRLAGLLTLAVPRDGGDLVAAGAHHAEYQGWLSDPEVGGEFIASALGALATRFPRARLRFLFLPPGAPVGWLSTRRWRGRVELRSHVRPLLVLGGGAAQKELRGKRYRVKRLERLGAVRVTHVTTPEDLDTMLDEIAGWTDLRQGAVHGVRPFEDDPLKKPFYRALMRASGVLDVSVMRAGAELASAHIGVRDRDRVVLGLIAHSPFLSRYSPGTLHLHLLAAALEARGDAVFDLTPGGAYKERFANGHDAVAVLTVDFARARAFLRTARRTAIAVASATLGTLRLTPERVRAEIGAQARRALHAARAGLTRLTRVADAAWSATDVMLIPAETGRMMQRGVGPMRRDEVPHLVAFGGSPGARARFLADALARLERGERVYTRLAGGRLAQWAWVVVDASIADPWLEGVLPPNSVVVRLHEAERADSDVYLCALAQIVGDVASLPGVAVVAVAARAHDARWSLVDRLAPAGTEKLRVRHAAGRRRVTSLPRSSRRAA